MFKDLLAISCIRPWLTAEVMRKHIHEVYEGKWLSDEIDWDKLFLGIKYKEPTLTK